MRFICDVCPATYSEGHAVIIGHYEKWIRHLLSLRHQAEQSLVMLRTTYWPEANWIALIKNLPDYGESTAEFYVDIMMQLSEYGFIEAIYYGEKTKDSVFVAIQLSDTKPVPSYFIGPDGTKYEINVTPRVQTSFAKGSGISKNGRRRFRCNSGSSTLSAEVSEKSVRDIATSPIPSSSSLLCSDNNQTEGVNSKIQTQGKLKQNRIKYNRDDLLQFCGEKTFPSRFSEILDFPGHIIVAEAKIVQPLEMQPVKWVVDTSAGNFNIGNRRNNGFVRTGGGGRRPFAAVQWNQNGRTNYRTGQDSYNNYQLKRNRAIENEPANNAYNDDEENW